MKKLTLSILLFGMCALARADNCFVTNDGGHPVPVTGSDITVNTTIDLTHVMSVPGATPSPSPAKALVVQGISGATAVAVTLPTTQYTITVANVTSGATIAAGKHHIEFILSSDFAGTIGGVTFTGGVGVYSPGDAPPGASLGALVYTVTAGSAILTTW
jgi:hypothetical protein